MAYDVAFHFMVMSNASNRIYVFRGNNHTETNAHVVGEEHLLIRDPAIMLNEGENRVWFRKAVDDVADFSSCSAEIQETSAGNMGERFDLQLSLEHG